MPPRSNRPELLQQLQLAYVQTHSQILSLMDSDPSDELSDSNSSGSGDDHADDDMNISSPVSPISPISPTFPIPVSFNLSDQLSDEVRSSSPAIRSSISDDDNMRETVDEHLRVLAEGYARLHDEILHPLCYLPVPRFPQLGLLLWARDHNERFGFSYYIMHRG